MENETVTVSKSELEYLVASNKALREDVNNLKKSAGEDEPTLLNKEVREHKARVTFIDGKPVVGFVNKGTDRQPLFVYEEVNPLNKSETILYVDVLLHGVKEAYKIKYADLMRNAQREECLIKSFKEEDWENIQGKVEESRLEGDDFTRSGTGRIVPIGATGKTRLYTMVLPNGTELELHEAYLNIA